MSKKNKNRNEFDLSKSIESLHIPKEFLGDICTIVGADSHEDIKECIMESIIEATADEKPESAMKLFEGFKYRLDKFGIKETSNEDILKMILSISLGVVRLYD